MEDMVSKMVGQKVEEGVKSMISQAMGGGDKDEEKGGDGGKKDEDKGFGIGDALSMVGGKKDDDKGFGIGDALSMVGGKKDDDKGPDVMGALTNLF